MSRPRLAPTEKKRLVTFYIDPDLAEALMALKDRGDAGEGEHIRRALRSYLMRHGLLAARADLMKSRLV
jgi:hypothetical protein